MTNFGPFSSGGEGISWLKFIPSPSSKMMSCLWKRCAWTQLPITNTLLADIASILGSRSKYEELWRALKIPDLYSVWFFINHRIDLCYSTGKLFSSTFEFLLSRHHVSADIKLFIYMKVRFLSDLDFFWSSFMIFLLALLLAAFLFKILPFDLI